MKNLQFLTIVLLILSSISLSAQFGPCTDDYDATADITAAEVLIAAVGDCYGDNWYTCRSAQLKLYQAEASLGNAVNDALVGNCLNCDIASLEPLAADINKAYGKLYSMGYSRYWSGLEGTIQQWKGTKKCTDLVHNPLGGPDITGKWTSDNGATIEISLDRVRNRYHFIFRDSSGESRTSAYYTSTFQIYAENWGVEGSVYDDAIVWVDQTWKRSKGGESVSSKKAGYYLIKISGSGYGKISSAQAARINGYHYYVHYKSADEDLSATFRKWKSMADQASRNACENGLGGHCPCPQYPTIWSDGPHYKAVDFTVDNPQKYWDAACEKYSIPQQVTCWAYDHTPVAWESIPCRLGN